MHCLDCKININFDTARVHGLHEDIFVPLYPCDCNTTLTVMAINPDSIEFNFVCNKCGSINKANDQDVLHGEIVCKCGHPRYSNFRPI